MTTAREPLCTSKIMLCRLLVLFLVAGQSCHLHGAPPQTSTTVSNAPGDAYPLRLQCQHLPNPVRLHAHVISGGLPEGEAAFRELVELGVKTIISVDGLRPDVDTAQKFGLRYVHLPHGYDGIPASRIRELAKAVRDLPGPIYIHCHHGKHRSPAAASVACVTAGLIPPQQALRVLELAGTDPRYSGLFQASRTAQPLDSDILDGFVMDFPASQQLPPLTEAMVKLGHAQAHLALIAAANWQVPAEHPDLVPEHETLMLHELFRELLRSEYDVQVGDDYRSWLVESEQAAGILDTELRQWQSAQPGSTAPANLNQRLQKINDNCRACHVKYRDTPLKDKG